MVCSQFVVQYLMSRSSRENLLASALVGGTVLALAVFALPGVSETLLPTWELGACLSGAGAGSTLGINPALALALAALVVGAVIAQWEPSQEVHPHSQHHSQHQRHQQRARPPSQPQ